MGGSVTYSSTLKPYNNSFSGQVSSIHAQVVSSNDEKRATTLENRRRFINEAFGGLEGIGGDVWDAMVKKMRKKMKEYEDAYIKKFMEDNNLEYIPGRKPLVRQKGSKQTPPPDKPKWL